MHVSVVITTRPTCKYLQKQIQPFNVHLHRHRRINWQRLYL